MEKTKVGVIGLGSIAQLVHLPNLVKLSNSEITSVSEIDKRKLNAIADKFSIPNRYSDYKELIDKSDIDVVIITTPTSLHAEIAIYALNSGKHVLVEKPFVRSFQEGIPVIEAAKKANKHVIVGMNLRHRPDAMLLKSVISSEEIGKIFYIKGGWIRRKSSEQDWFMKKEESGGGVIIDIGIVLLDLALWLLDYPKVEAISCQNFYQNTKNIEDSSISFLRCNNSRLVSLETSWSLPMEKASHYFTVYGTNGYATLNPFSVFKKYEDQYIEVGSSQTENSAILFQKSYLNELKNFIGAIRGINPLVSTGEEALERLRIVEAMYRSSAEHKEITLS
ncbi:MAG: gfo/Idh/MocA family oxidoreductase [Ignavibacteriales bacterium CG_4_9_14_3_um_filter_30_11]|nr:MAG: gfo/Idh/MocA family oxidoreductase [Ignavibacteriales bacterium CG_4_9_14_3_um_filter_30_11]